MRDIVAAVKTVLLSSSQSENSLEGHHVARSFVCFGISGVVNAQGRQARIAISATTNRAHPRSSRLQSRPGDLLPTLQRGGLPNRSMRTQPERVDRRHTRMRAIL